MSTLATFKYNLAANLFATAQIDWATVGTTAHCALLNDQYSPSMNDQYLSEIPAGAIVADQAFTSTGVTANGVCYGAIPTFNALISSAPVAGMLIYISTGVSTTSPLIYYSSNGIGFPFTPQGFNYAVAYDALSGGFFQE